MPVHRYFAARDLEHKHFYEGKSLTKSQKLTNQAIEQGIRFFSLYNQVLPLVFLAFTTAISAGSAKWRMLGHLLLGLAIAGIPVWLGKLLIARQRPRWFTGTTWQETFRGLWPKKFELQSLPSGDAAVAFAVSFILAGYFPRHRVILYILAAGCALTRIVREYHYLSDALLGALIGYLAARAVAYLSRPGRAESAGE